MNTFPKGNHITDWVKAQVQSQKNVMAVTLKVGDSFMFENYQCKVTKTASKGFTYTSQDPKKKQGWMSWQFYNIGKASF